MGTMSAPVDDAGQVLLEAETALLRRSALYVAHPAPMRRFRHASEGVGGLLGRESSRLVADPALWATSVDPRDRGRVELREQELVAGERARLEYRVRHADGRLVWVADDVLLTEDEQGRLLHGSMTDVTDIRRGEAILAAHDAVLEGLAAGRETEQVLSVVSELIEEFTGAAGCRIEPWAAVRGDVAGADETGMCRMDLTISAGTDPELLGWLVVPDHLVVAGEQDPIIGRAAQLATMVLVRATEQRHLGESVALLEATLESTEDGILSVDSDGRTLGYNKKFTDMWHIDAELVASKDDARMIGFVLSQLVDPDGFVAGVTALYGSPTRTSFDELHFLDGRVFERYSQPQLVGGQAVGRVWSFRDVTAKRRLQQDMELFGAVAAASNSASTVEEALSETMAAVCRYGSWEMGHALLVPEQDAAALRHSVWHEAQPGRLATLREVTARSPVDALSLPAKVLGSGRPEVLALGESAAGRLPVQPAEQDVAWTCAFPVTARDEVVGVLQFWASSGQACDDRLLRAMDQVGSQVGRVIERDRSERRLARHARQMERLTRQLDSVLNSAGEGIYGADASGHITFVNEAAAQLLRMPREAMLGRAVDEVIRVEECHVRVGLTDVAAKEGGSPRVLTGRHHRADGSTFDSELSSAPILEDGAVVGSVGVLRDISERRAVDRLKDEFISMVSHELRTPLTSIRGALGLLGAGSAGELGPRAARMVEVATLSSDRLIRLINDILDVERMAAGKLAIHLRPTSVRQLLEAATEEMAGLADSSGVMVKVMGGSGTVAADPDRIAQTLGNLLGNAVKFSRMGGTVELEATELDGHVRFDVSDSGPGIPEEELETIFQPFRQVDGSDARQTGGSGLGLAICRGLVERHGGRIWASSELGRGTTLSFTLPTAEATTEQ